MGEVRVKVQFGGVVANISGGDKVEVDLPQGASARDLINHLVKEYGSSLRNLLFNSKGDLRAMASILVNDRDVSQSGGLDAPLGDLNQVTIAISFRPSMGG